MMEPYCRGYISRQAADICFWLLIMEVRHRYLREVNCSRHIISKNHFHKIRALAVGTNKAGGLTRQVSQVNKCAALTANIFAAATNRLNIHKTGGTNIS
jgi:hypothetical protein